MKNIKLAVVIVAVVMLVGVFFLLKPDSSSSSTATTDALSGEQAESRVVKLSIANGKLTTGDTTVKARQNEKITLEVSSDTTDELHLHGYNKTVDLKPNTEGKVTFMADKSGSFEAELHGAESTVFVLEVRPE